MRGASLRVAAASGRRYAQLDLGAPRSALSAQRSAALNFEDDVADDVAADERAVVGSFGHGDAHDDARAADAPVTAPDGAAVHADGGADAAVTAAAAAGHRARRAAAASIRSPAASIRSPASISAPAGTLGTALGTAPGTALGTAPGTTLAHESPRLSQAAALNDVEPALLHDLICRGGPRGGGGGGGTGGCGGAGGLLRLHLSVHSLRTLTLRVRCTACHEVRLRARTHAAPDDL